MSAAATQVATAPTVSRLGVDGWLVRFGESLNEATNNAALAFGAKLTALNPPWLEEISTSLVSTYIRFDLDKIDSEDLTLWLEALLASADWSTVTSIETRSRFIVPAVFGGDAGAQLREAAALAGISEAQAVKEICAKPLRVQTIGFAPGLPYLGMLDEHWNIPRQTELTPQVERGAIVVAVRQIVLFSKPSQTGWRQVGRCGFRPFNLLAEEPFQLKAGDEIQFEAASHEQLASILEAENGGARRVEIA